MKEVNSEIDTFEIFSNCNKMKGALKRINTRKFTIRFHGVELRQLHRTYLYIFEISTAWSLCVLWSVCTIVHSRIQQSNNFSLCKVPSYNRRYYNTVLCTYWKSVLVRFCNKLLHFVLLSRHGSEGFRLSYKVQNPRIDLVRRYLEMIYTKVPFELWNTISDNKSISESIVIHCKPLRRSQSLWFTCVNKIRLYN